jgi:hypothetical protein
MTAVLIIIGILLLILLTPVALCVYYDGKWKIRISVLCFSFALPLEKDGEKKKDKKTKPQKVKTDNKELLKQLSDLRKIIPVLVKRALATLTVKKLDFEVKVATQDPCLTAIMYGSVNAAVYSTVKIIQQHIKVKKKRISVSADFDGDKTEVLFDMKISTYLLKLIICLISLVSDGIIDIGDFINKKEK